MRKRNNWKQHKENKPEPRSPSRSHDDSLIKKGFKTSLRDLRDLRDLREGLGESVSKSVLRWP
jgi:hypothetical protein